MFGIKFSPDHIAPCGANCGTCMAFLRSERNCSGCRSEDQNKPVSCKKCIIRNCGHLSKSTSGFCFECDRFPCERLNQLDARYQKNFAFSMIENLRLIEKVGIHTFLENEIDRWACSNCGGNICLHRGYCTECGYIWYVHSGNNRAQIR